MESIEAELAIKSSLVDALNAENEQLRMLLQKHADRDDHEHTSRLQKGDMRRESNINELQAALVAMRSQLHEGAMDADAQLATLAELRAENARLRADAQDSADELTALRQRLTLTHAQLAEERARFDDERAKVLALRAGLEESKKAIAILNEQNERRNSDLVAATSRRASEAAQGTLAVGSGSGSSLARKSSLVNVNVSVISEHRRGSVNYLSGLGLTSKRLNHFDPNSAGAKKLSLGSARTESDLAALAGTSASTNADSAASIVSPNRLNRRASLPASPAGTAQSRSLVLAAHATGQDASSAANSADAATSPVHFSNLSRRSSLTAGRRASLGYDSPTRRTSNLNQALIRLNGGVASADDGELPNSRRASTTINEEEGNGSEQQSLTQLADTGVRRKSSFAERRSSSAHLANGYAHLAGASSTHGPSGLRQSIDHGALFSASYSLGSTPEDGQADPRPATVMEEAHSPTLSVSYPMSMRTTTFPPAETDGVVQALSLEAAMEISALKDMVAELKMQLLEAEECREASDTCARALREFIATQAAVETTERVKLPPLPTDASADADAEAELASAREKEKKQTEGAAAAATAAKRSSRWGMPKLLPSLSYSSIRRDASNSIVSHLPAIAGSSNGSGKAGLASIADSSSSAPLPPQLAISAPARSTSSSGNATPLAGTSPALLSQPGWRTTGDLRHLSVSSAAGSTGTSSAAPSPILSSGVPNFQSTFQGFSFSNAYRYVPPTEVEEPPSPGGGRSDAPTFPGLDSGASVAGSLEGDADVDALSESASATDESEVESLPRTPLDATFGGRTGAEVQEVEKEKREEEMRIASDPTMTPRAVHTF